MYGFYYARCMNIIFNELRHHILFLLLIYSRF